MWRCADTVVNASPNPLSRVLGVGGMGEVYRARDSKLNREVAIKVLLPAVAGDAERLARFAREAQVLNALFPLLNRDREVTLALFELIKNQPGY